MRALPLAALISLGSAAQAQEPPIQDNSFLIEEAYNQEKRVVQHISAFFHAKGGWWYTFTQEWPMGGQRSQLSYTLPVIDGAFGDVALNYRLQLVGPAGNVAVSPRVSLVLPTSDWQNASTGVQLNLPVSARVASHMVTHWNAGASFARNESALALGASAIYELQPTLNLMLEWVWTRLDDGPSATTELFVNPGIRWAHNFRSGLQVVPGIAVPIRVGNGGGEAALFLYLSLEHAF